MVIPPLAHQRQVHPLQSILSQTRQVSLDDALPVGSMGSVVHHSYEGGIKHLGERSDDPWSV